MKISYETLRRFDDRLEHLVFQVGRLIDLVLALKTEVEKMSPELQQVIDKVNQLKAGNDAILVLVTSMAQRIRDLKDDPAALVQLANDLDVERQRIADAVAANTPIEGKMK